MEFTDRPRRAMVYVEPDGLKRTVLEEWLTAAASFVNGLPRKHR